MFPWAAAALRGEAQLLQQENHASSHLQSPEAPEPDIRRDGASPLFRILPAPGGNLPPDSAQDRRIRESRARGDTSGQAQLSGEIQGLPAAESWRPDRP